MKVVTYKRYGKWNFSNNRSVLIPETKSLRGATARKLRTCRSTVHTNVGRLAFWVKLVWRNRILEWLDYGEQLLNTCITLVEILKNKIRMKMFMAVRRSGRCGEQVVRWVENSIRIEQNMHFENLCRIVYRCQGPVTRTCSLNDQNF